jgi:signal transduction histidine kinase
MVRSSPPAARRHVPPRERSNTSVLRALLVVFAAVVLLFAAFEVVERLWLSELEPELLRMLHRIRGVVVALITAGAAGWVLVRDGPPLLAAGPFGDDPERRARLDAERKRRHYARWFIVMRWLAIVVATVAVIGAVEVAQLLPAVVAPSLFALLTLLTLLNLAYTLYLREMGASTAFLAFQVYADIFVLILLLHFSGGIENPLTPLLLLNVIIAGIVLGRGHAYVVAVVASSLFGLLAWAEYSGALPHYTLRVFPHIEVDGIMLHAAHMPLYVASRSVLQALIMLLVAYFTTTLVERIRQDERQLAGLADRARAQTQTLERALDTTGTALCVCDREMRPSWANRRWSEWVRQVPELQCGGRCVPGSLPPTLADGRVRNEELHVPGTDGRPSRVFQLTVAPLRDRDGSIGNVVTLARDITAQHEAQARVVRTERLAAVGELAGQVAHEVNNPIAIISAKVRLLLRDGGPELPPRAVAELTKVTELTDRVARIAQGLLSYCRPAPGVRTPLDVRVPVRRALAYVEPRAAEQHVLIRDEVPDGLPAVTANASELEQVFLNLFLNALDAMPDGGALRVTAGMESRGGADGRRRVVLEVADTGEGIPAELRQRVFEPFLTTKGGKGSGLGLSICQGLINSHGGAIDIDSEPGAGTRVLLTLPAVVEPAAGNAADSAAHTAADPAGDPAADPAGDPAADPAAGAAADPAAAAPRTATGAGHA